MQPILAKSFNGHALSSYRAVIQNFNIPAQAQPKWVDLANSDPAYAGVFSGQVRSIVLDIESTSDALDEQLKTWFERGTGGYLVITLTEGISLDYQLYCVVQSLAPNQYHWTATLQAGASAWRRVTTEVAAWTANNSTLTRAVTVSGGRETRLIATITPTAASGTDWPYQSVYQLVNKPKYDYGNRPWCVTLDTRQGAYPNNGKFRTDCYDIRVSINGKDVRRYIADPNTDHTKVWFTVPLHAGQSLKLRTALTLNGAAGELQFERKSTTTNALKALPNDFLLQDGAEIIQCSGKNLAQYKCGVVARGVLGTTQPAHAIGATFNWIENAIVISCGNLNATDPSADDPNYNDDKPVFDLSASANTAWVYTATSLFYDPTLPTRPGSWTPSIVRKGDVSGTYNYTQDGESGAPALGVRLADWQKSGKWQPETATLAWTFHSAGGINNVSMTGSKWRNTARWPSGPVLQRANVAGTWYTVWSDGTPVSLNTWTAFTYASQATSDMKFVRAALTGSITALASALCKAEILTATVTFTSANLPAGTALGEASNYYAAMRLTNTTTGDAVTLRAPVGLNKVLLMDGENFKVTIDNTAAADAITLDDESRDTWIRLLPGNNDLAIEALSGDLGTVSVALSWYPRRQP
jgi:hypothetical protein